MFTIFSIIDSIGPMTMPEMLVAKNIVDNPRPNIIIKVVVNPKIASLYTRFLKSYIAT